MKRTVMAIIEVEDNVNDGQVLDTFEKSLDQNNCNIENAIILDKDSDSVHERYLNYLMSWIADHHEDEFKGCSPACFDEWLDNEYEENEEDIDDENVSEDEDIGYESVADLVLDEGDYERDDYHGEIRINKQVFDDFVKHSYIKIQFVNDNGDDNVYTYIMESEDDEFITCEFIG